MPHITTCIKPSGKLSCLLPERRSAPWFLAGPPCRILASPPVCLVHPGLEVAALECLHRSSPGVHSGWKGRLEALPQSCICKASTSLLLDCIFICVWIGCTHYAEAKSTRPCLCQCFLKSFSYFPITIQEVEMIPIAFKVNLFLF